MILLADDWSRQNPGKNLYLRWHTVWDSSVDSQHAFLKFAAEPDNIAEVIEVPASTSGGFSFLKYKK